MKNTKNICFFNSSITWGGGEKWHHVIAMKLKNRGYKVIVCTNFVSELKQRLANNGIPLYSLRVKNLSFLNPILIYKAYRIFKDNKTDTVIFGLPSDVKAAGIAAKIAGVRKIIYRRGTALPVKNSLINRILYKYVITDIIANSVEIKNKFLERNHNLCPASHLHIVYNGVEVNHQPILAKSDKQKPHLVLGNAGRLVEQKGQKYLIELAAILKKKDIDFTILIAGKGILEDSLKKYARHLNVEKHISFLGFIEDMDSFFNSIDLFLLPSIHEGSANIVLEAMSYGKPVIAFNASSMTELVENDKTGYLVNLGDIDEYANRILYLNNHPAICNQMAGNAFRVVNSKFNIDNCLQQLQGIIHNFGKLKFPDFEPEGTKKVKKEVTETFTV